MNWRAYQRLETIYDYMYYLQETYPHLAEIVDLGQSVEGRSILLLKVGSKVYQDKPAIFIEAGNQSAVFHTKITSHYLQKINDFSNS